MKRTTISGAPMPSLQSIAAILGHGVTVEQVRTLFQRNAADLRAMKPSRGFTASQLRAMAASQQSQADRK